MLPFDAHRSGIVISEGSGIIVLERGDRARARGAKILGYLQGYGSLADAYHPSTPDPSGQWEARAMSLAIESAGRKPEDVDAVIAHATGTPKGDTAEIHAINKLFGGRSKPLPAVSIKGLLGHPGGPSGAMGLVVGLGCMHGGKLFHNGGTSEADPEADFDVVIGKPRDVDIRTLVINAFGFGGQNASILVTRDSF